MSLAVGYSKNSILEYKLSFEDDGYYWYLHPYFEKLRNVTGIYIDLYGDAKFTRDNINQLESIITEIKTGLSKKTEYFDVHCGTQLLPKKEIYMQINKHVLTEKLEALSGIIETVKKYSGELVFEGD